MKLPPRKYLPVLGVLLLLLACWWAGGFRPVKPARLEVQLLAVTQDPMHRQPERSTVLNGINSLGAIFAVTNCSPEASLWFDTSAVEQKVNGEWRRTAVPLYPIRVAQTRASGGTPWWGIASADVNNKFPPGTCWNYVVEWPRDVPTNATWRLELRYGRLPSTNAVNLDNALGVQLFARRGKGQAMLTPEVCQ